MLEEPGSARVDIELKNGGTISVEVGKRGENSAGKIFSDACQKASPFLSRNELIGVPNNKPADRFRYLESFLDFDQADTAHTAVADLAHRKEEDAKREEATLEGALRPIVSQLPADLRISAVTWAPLDPHRLPPRA